jgi:predicted DNA-binding transcriptional regulator YafY
MRASRLLTILILLQVRGRISAEALARELEVSVRTIYRDVDQLGAAGVPVYAERGRHGGFQLLGGFRTNLTGLTPHESDAVSLIGMAQAAVDLGLGEAAQSARLKILASVPASASVVAHRVAQRFHLDPAPWYSRPAPPARLRELAEAVWSSREIRITYESWKGEVKRTVAPLGLVMKAGSLYFAGAVQNTARAVPRIYRVAAIRELEITAHSAQRPRNFDLAKFWHQAAREFESNLRSDTARVRLSPLGRKLLRDWDPAAADAVDGQHASGGDAWVEANIPVEKLPHAAREVLRLGAEIEVLEPTALREAIALEARKIALLHGPKRPRGKSRP